MSSHQQINQEVLSLLAQDSNVLNVVVLGEAFGQTPAEFYETVGAKQGKNSVDVKYVELLWDRCEDDRASTTLITNRSHHYVARIWRTVGIDPRTSRSEIQDMAVAIMDRLNENARLSQQNGLNSTTINRISTGTADSVESMTDNLTGLIYYTTDISFTAEERIRYSS